MEVYVARAGRPPDTIEGFPRPSLRADLTLVTGVGAPKIRERLRRQYAPARFPAISTVPAVLDRHGLVRRRGWAGSKRGFSYYFARQYDRALSAYRDALELDGHLDFPWVLGWIYREKGSTRKPSPSSGKSTPSPFAATREG
jgi:hypothetical protein